MNIAFDAKRIFHNHTGLGNYSRAIVEGVQSTMPDAQIYLCNPKRQDNPYPGAQMIVPTKLRDRLFPSIWRSVHLAKDLKRYPIDVYHGLSGELPKGIAQTGIPSVVTIHDLIFMRYPQWYKAIDRNIYTHKSRYACEHADVVVAITEQTKADIIHYFGTPEEKIRVIYQGCHPRYAQATMQESVLKRYGLERGYILCVGSLIPRKNQAQIIEAWTPGMPKIVLVGRGESYKKTLIQLAAAQGKSEALCILETVTDEELPSIYQGAGVFVYPSIFEGFGIPILEALNSGVPVIAGKGSCFPEAGGSNSCYVAQDDPMQLRSALQSILSDRALAQKMIDAGKQHAQQFEQAVWMAQWKELYRSMVD